MSLSLDEGSTFSQQQSFHDSNSNRRRRRAPSVRHGILLMLLALAALAAILNSLGILNGNGEYYSYNSLLMSSASTEQWLADAGLASPQLQRTLEERAWDREKERRNVIRERLQRQRNESTVSLNVFPDEKEGDDLVAPTATTLSSVLVETGTLYTVPESGKFDWHLPPVRSSDYTLDEPQLFGNNTMIVVVLSARSNFERRAVVRQTWARSHGVYFVVGAPAVLPEDDSVNDKLHAEQEEHHDLLDCMHPDLYSSLPYKVRFAYQWIVSRLPHVDWIVKVDDDTVVRVDTLQNAFLRSFNPRIPVVVGRIIERSPVARTGKWAEMDYQKSHYPYWPQGSCGHVVSRVVAAYIASMEPRSFTYYQGEDTSIGIWLDQAPADQLEPVTWIHSKYFSNDGACLKHAWLVMGHEISAENMRRCHAAKDEWAVAELTHKHWNYWSVDTLKWTKDQATWK